MTVNLENAAISLLNSVLALMLALYFYSNFSAGKNEYRFVVISCSFIIFSFSLIAVKAEYINFAITTVCTYLYTLAYKIKSYNRILLTLSYVAVNAITEVLSALSIMVFFNVSLDDIKGGWLNAVGILLSKVLTLVIVVIIIYSRHHMLLGKFRLHWLGLYSLPLATMLVLVVQHYYLYYISDAYSLKIISAVGMLMLILSNLLIFRITDKIHNSVITENKLALAEQLIKKQSDQYKMLMYNNQSIIKMRHDCKNVLLGILSEMEAGSYDNVKSKLTANLTELESLAYMNITGNSVFDIILTYKTAQAESHGIKLSCQCHSLSNLDIPGTDISVLLGNALDNAIEATKKLSDDCEKKISVIIAYRNGCIWITVLNSVNKNIDTNNLSTDKMDSENHGIGIVTMRKIVEKYNGELYFECLKKQFKTVIILEVSNE